MPASPFNSNYTALWRESNPNTLIVAPTLAQRDLLRRAFALLERERQRDCWESHQILTLKQWQQNCLNDWQWTQPELSDHALLSVFECQQLWRDIISGSDVNDGLISVDELARMADHAWTILHDWDLPTPANWASQANADQRVFANWASEFERICSENGWLDPARTINLLIQLAQSNADCAEATDALTATAQRVIAIDKPAWTPQQQRWLSAFNTEWFEPNCNPSFNSTSVTRLDAADQQQSVTTLSQWLDNQCQPGNHRDAANTMAVIVPDTSALKQWTQLLQAAMPQAGVQNWQAVALADQPVIRSALLLIRWWHQPLAIDEVSQLLRAPWLDQSAQQASERAQWEWQQRTMGYDVIDLATLATTQPTTRGAQTKTLPTLWQTQLNGWAAQADKIRQLAPKLSAEVWCHEIKNALSQAGWPAATVETPEGTSTESADTILSSEDYALVDRWVRLLDELPGLPTAQQPQTARHWLQQLSGWTQSQSAPRPAAWRQHRSLLSVLLPQEAAALSFDAMAWVDFDTAHWPLRVRTHPFIPSSLQQSAGVHQCDHAGSVAWAKNWQTMTVAQTSALAVLDPVAAADDDTSPLLSPLLDDLLLTVTPMTHTVDSVLQVASDMPDIELLTDEIGPTVTPTEANGGSRLLRLQSACPFRAFSEVRLQAEPFPWSVGALDPMERGRLVHTALELFWSDVGSHQNLAALTQNRQLDARVKTHVDRAVAQWQRHAPTGSQAFGIAERRRLYRLLNDWLAIELTRPPFTVAAVEHQQTIELGGLSLRLRIDRIDQVESSEGNCERIIIDYKTGSATPSAWLGDRPHEPQLPLYLVSEPDSVVALLYARLDPRQLGFAGVSADPDLAKALKVTNINRWEAPANWIEWKAQWGGVLKQLATAFHDGQAAVDPRDDQDCQYCHLHGLCRVHEGMASWQPGGSPNAS